MSDTLTFWFVIIAVGALTYLSRLSFIALFARQRMPSLVARALRYVPAAMLTAIVVSAVVLGGAGDPDAAPAGAKAMAATVAALVAWRTRSVVATIVTGMAVLWLVRWLLTPIA